MATRDQNSWIYDFSLVLTPDAIRRIADGPGYEAFTGSKARAYPWLVVVAMIAGAFGGIMVSGALWSRWWQVPLWLAAVAAFVTIVRRITTAAYPPPIGFLVGWCVFFGIVTGAFAMWGAQLTSGAWAYGIAGGLMFFLIGITGGLIPPPNAKEREDWFLTSAIMAPIGGCAAVWIYRDVLPDPSTLLAAGLTGVIAALPFLALTMALHLAAWRPARGMKKLAMLRLHSDGLAAEAIPLLDAAIAEDDGDAEAVELRALGHALVGRSTEAEADWARLTELTPGTNAPDIGRGWAALRRGDNSAAMEAFAAAKPARKHDAWVLKGLGITHLRQGESAAALEALNAIPARAHDALSLTYLAEAWLGVDDLPNAIATAADAIEEADSIHGRTWLVRAEAYRRRGKIDSAAEDYNRALWAADEVGIEERAIAGLEAIDRPVSSDEPEW